MIPSCSAVIDYTGAMWYVKGDKRYEIPSRAIFKSWEFPTIYRFVHETIHESTEYGGKLGIRPGTMCFSIFDGGYWYISERGKHRVADPELFRAAGITLFNVRKFSRKDLALHEELEPLE